MRLSSSLILCLTGLLHVQAAVFSLTRRDQLNHDVNILAPSNDTVIDNDVSFPYLAADTIKYMLTRSALTPLSPDDMRKRYAETTKDMPVRETEFNFNDRYQVDVVFRYAMLASFPYCTKEQALDMRNKKIPDINNNPKLLLTADNSVVNWESRSGEHWLISVSHTHKTLTVAFRGTFGLYDTMFYNADSRQVNIDSNLYSGFNGRAKIYKGVMRSLLIHVPRAREALRLLKAKYSNYHIIVTGHSLGASIARMFSLHLSLTEQELKPLMTYAFAEPMTTTKEFSDWSLSVIGRDHYLRIISSTDIVPHLRPGKNKFGHAKDAIVMYFPDPDKPEFIYCPHDGHPACRGVGARKRSWFNHNRFGGMILASNMCALVMEKQTLKNLLTIAKKMIT